MPKINILPKSVYSLIAAGEVVERPLNVVKEMLENSIDAGASHITVEIKNGGISYIRITDDGCGISPSDVPKVFVSHATSKIEKESDLNSIGTLGFRGEAMASIAAVSKVEMLTRPHESEFGTNYIINGGQVIKNEQSGCPEGTTIIVRDIFYNVPARMKFLKKDVTEGNSIQGIIDRIALSHPEISFKFIRDGRQAVVTSGKNNLKDTIYSVLGGEFASTLIPVEYSYSGMNISGYVTRPHQSRKSRAMQFFYINGRYVKSRTILAALEQAYKNTIMVGHFPGCVLNLKIDTRLTDVNVHPSKIEVRFSNEKSVFDLVYYGVKTAIETKNDYKNASDDSPIPPGRRVSAKIDFGVKPEKPEQIKIDSSNPYTQIVQNNDTWKLSSPGAVARNDERYGNPEDYKIKSPSAFSDGEIVREGSYQTFVEFTPRQSGDDQKSKSSKQKTETTPDSDIEDGKSENNPFSNYKIIGEAFNTYIIIQTPKELFYIDKHAAHERMNFERLKAEAKSTGIATQVLLSPVAVRLSADEYTAVVQNLDLLKKCGIVAEDFGNSSVIVRETPSIMDGSGAKELIEECAEKLLEHKTDVEPEKMEWIFNSTSCRAAVKGGDYTSPQERELFVKKLLSMPDIRYCPHGRPVMVRVSKYEIEKLFGRIQ